MKKNWYAIKKGRSSNVIVATWPECSGLVTGYPGAVFKGFEFREGAKSFLAKPSFKLKAKKKKNASKVKKVLGKCIQRKSYTDPFTGIYYKNRCVEREYKTMTGVDYVPSNDTSIPWL